MLNLLFAYGILRSGFENPYAHLLRTQAEAAGAAAVSGSIYRVGNFPAYKSEPARQVHGELYRLKDPETILKSLDEYEGEDFERIVVDGYWIYQYVPDPPENSLIPSGDFRAP